MSLLIRSDNPSPYSTLSIVMTTELTWRTYGAYRLIAVNVHHISKILSPKVNGANEK